MKKAIIILLTVLLSLYIQAQQLHESYPQWQKGDFDALMINTGRGDAMLITMPDGTRMLIDAGELDLEDPRTWSPRNTTAKPNASRFAYQWISHYIRILTPKGEKPVLDYSLITHFHDDHYGLVYDGSAKSCEGGYLLSGITGVGDNIPIRKIVDRGYPDYNQPYNLEYHLANGANKKEYQTFINYKEFLDYHKKESGLVIEKFDVGSDTQFVPKSGFSGFKIRNLYANGYTANKEIEPLYSDTASYKASENNVSCALRINYGKFSMFIGGDITGIGGVGDPQSYNVESAIAPLIGRVDVAVANHHAGRDVLNSTFIGTLRPRVWMQSVWSSDQPAHKTLIRLTSKGIYPDDRDLFATNILDVNRNFIGDLVEKAYKSTDGHILLRVKENGEYYIYILDSDRNDLKLKQKFGPYSGFTK
ncbi:beta-lactamase superfamily II metal-dependent hydrolase [Dysgonomonas hofstadii]|uniref:Beta-lactamase superfamily II metal-dependent hydrolase n=1 Tax=Dysgonomonas hofstadii TaxID=637886 RepID=A0A840CL94_9BACT|nr:hypothetical protein [Dysgonomonas hofstadii]MBB4034818.1 beta-lactamase superfamily II metal-dependent hydrolase [Dysgonomonas hofstadii]